MFAQLGLNRKDTVKTAEEIGWWDPEIDSKEASKKTMHWLKQISFYNFIYPRH